MAESFYGYAPDRTTLTDRHGDTGWVGPAFGYGRVDLIKTLQWLHLGQISPVACITSPAWSANLDLRKEIIPSAGDQPGYAGDAQGEHTQVIGPF